MLPPEDYVFGLLNSEDPFPIDFEDAWRWVEYSRKDTAKEALTNPGNGFVQGVDYIFPESPGKIEGKGRGRPAEVIKLTFDCFKLFCMMAGTPKGREVRLYFLECEKQLKRILAQQQVDHQTRVLRAYVAAERLPWRKKYTEEYYEQIHRLKGWDYDPQRGRTPLLGKITNDIVYKRLQPGVLEELRRKNPLVSGHRRYRHHQFLTDNIGNPHLRSHLSFLIGLMKGCNTWNSFMMLLNRCKPSVTGVQHDIFFELLESGDIGFDEWENLVS